MFADPEICICAAVQLADGHIVRGQHHVDCLASVLGVSMHDCGLVVAEEGFLTSRNRFVTREEGYRLQRNILAGSGRLSWGRSEERRVGKECRL